MNMKMDITMGEPCIACTRGWNPAGIGYLMGAHMSEALSEAKFCERHLSELRQSLNEEGYKWLDESMRVPVL